MPDAAKISDKHTVGLCIFNDSEEAFFPRLLDARRGEVKAGRRRSLTDAGDEVAVAADVLEISVDRLNPAGERGIDLGFGAAEDAERGSCHRGQRRIWKEIGDGDIALASTGIRVESRLFEALDEGPAETVQFAHGQNDLI